MAHRRSLSLLLAWLLLLVACAPGTPTASSTVTTARPSSATGAVPTATQVAQSLPTPTLVGVVVMPTLPTLPTPQVSQTPQPLAVVAATTFVVPAAATAQAGPEPLPGASFAHPNVGSEAQSIFERFYAARTLAPGGTIDVDRSAKLVGEAYADYTLPLLRRDAESAKAGDLREIHYTGIKTTVQSWDPASGMAQIAVTRTRTDTTSAGTGAGQTATYQFRLKRQQLDGDGVTWLIVDFLNPATNAWVSAPAQSLGQQVTGDLQHFFEEFYADRSRAPGGQLAIDKTALLTALAYQQYTMPLLKQQQAEIDRGDLISVAYRDINVKLLTYDPNATNHGGIATVSVTRTSLVTRASGPEVPQTATYLFRVHRHTNEAGKAYWLAVDFLQPVAQKWVSELQGMSVAVPPSGFG